MQFMIIAWDGKDPEAPARRAAVREAHLEGAARMHDTGHLIAGGAILDDEGNMIGSTLYMDFDSREELDEWLEQDPYVTGDVWREIDIKPIRLAVAL